MGKTTVTIHVAPTGNDSWSGRIPAPDATGKDGPLATLEQARDLARIERQKNGPNTKIQILIHGGVYRRQTPLVLTAEDSGTAEAPTVWRGCGDEPTVVTGLQPLPAAWKPGEGGVWTLQLPTGAAVPTAFRQLFCNGRRLARTRWPKQGYLSVHGFAGSGEDDHKRRFRFYRGDVLRWENLDDAEFVVIHNWSESRLFVESLDETRDTVEFTGPAAYPFDFGGWNSFYVENVHGALGEPGQWYLDRRQSLLRLMPPLDVSDPNAAEFSVPAADTLIELRGIQGEAVTHIHIEDITFTGTRWQMPPAGYANPGGAEGPHVRPAGITFEHAQECTLRNCAIEASAGYAVELQDCRGCVVSHTTIREAGGGGIIIFDGCDNAVADCHIHDCGRLYFGGTGVVNPSGVRTHIHHNHIHHMPYCGIRGGNWGTPLSEIIEYNHVHHVMLVLDDGAAIFNAGIGSTIRHNLVHDSIGGRHGFALGLYLDEYRTGVLMEKNVVYNTGSALLHLHNNYGNTIVNNIFANGGAQQVSWTTFHGTHFGRRVQPYRHALNTFQRNIVYWREGCLSHNLDCNRWDLASQPELIDYNLYWKAGAQDIESPRLGRIPATQVRLGLGHCAQPGIGHDTLADWQELGLDHHSANVDPLFVDPGRNDFRLREDSPALALGFEPIDLSHIGPRDPEARDRL